VQVTGRDDYGKEEDKIDFEVWTHFVCTTFERGKFFFRTIVFTTHQSCCTLVSLSEAIISRSNPTKPDKEESNFFAHFLNIFGCSAKMTCPSCRFGGWILSWEK
jgi:hypothetical protein